ncbi:S8 family serine peptidase [Cryobacterium roopkundense]|uniref:Subtilisin family serine protease n=1 Tax=Cryobacterium roopkundense TaxID=1001240 RepID=A0A7W9E201_9MICO|nr:S8 family serine peptidase [Cryobacterium roopkundense]MBB5639651.1 subtilisin family serine protease [Cryobacterium roopkundense]
MKSVAGSHRAISGWLFDSLASALALGLVASSLVGGVAAMAAVAPPPSSTASAATGVGQPRTDLGAGRYIVTLNDSAAATYTGGVAGFVGTKPGAGKKFTAQTTAVAAYSTYLLDQQQKVAASVDARIGYSYTLALNGFAANLSAKQAVQLASLKNVATITPEGRAKTTEVRSPDFLGLTGANGVWDGTGGADRAGDGVVVGVLDTGIAPENPSFAGDRLGTDPGDEPYIDGDTIRFTKSDGGVFTGACTTGAQFGESDCTTKIVSARYFVDGYGAGNIGGPPIGEYLSPRDGFGHGSHTSSIAAGNLNVRPSVDGNDNYGVISGVAPAARIAVYKVCWSGQDPTSYFDDYCTYSDILSGIEQAVADGVDVLNYSIGGGPASTTVSPIDLAFLGAASAGIFVAAAGGNAGPGPSTLDNASPWITTLAAGSLPQSQATATLGDGSRYTGSSVSVFGADGTPVAAPLVRADLVATPGAADPLGCGANALDPTRVTGTVVLCRTDALPSTVKSAEVLRAGGVGMLLVNEIPGSVEAAVESVPSLHLDDSSWAPLVDYAATAQAEVSFAAGDLSGSMTPAPQVADFSSRGPVEADGSDILKPDVTAPGVSVLGAWRDPLFGTQPTWVYASGTSMATPHAAGLAALYLGEHPLATPAEIKSAMMTTAYNTVDPLGAPITDPFQQGAGHVDPTKYLDPGLLYLNGPADWYAYMQGIGYDVGVTPIDASELNLASIAIGSLSGTQTITRTVTSASAGEFTVEPVTIPGVTTVVAPRSMTFGAAGETQSYTVTFTRTDAAFGQFATGSLDWVSYAGASRLVVHSPVAVRPIRLPFVAPAVVEGAGITGAVDVTVTPGDSGDVPLRLSGLAPGVRIPNPADPADPHTGRGKTAEQFTYDLEMPDATALARFDLDGLVEASDLDLVIYQLDGPGGTPSNLWGSWSLAANERVELMAPIPGYYRVLVNVFSGASAFDVTTFLVPSAAGEGALAATPPVLAAQSGVPTTYSLSWSGLTPQTGYLGLVNYTGTVDPSGLEATTTVFVQAGQAPAPVNMVLPSITGKAEVGHTLRAHPGEWTPDGLTYGFQWQADGVDIPNATAKRYRVGKAAGGKTVAVVVTASKPGLATSSATSAGIAVKFTSKTTIRLKPAVASSSQRVKVKVAVVSDEPVQGEEVTVTVARQRYTVTLNSHGAATVRLAPLHPGRYTVSARFPGNDRVSASKSPKRTLRVEG